MAPGLDRDVSVAVEAAVAGRPGYGDLPLWASATAS
jgi:hypothetical protein